MVDHPNVIKFYEIFQDKDSFHLVMEYLEGRDLEAYFNCHHETINEKVIA
jgi:serine/threonine protein kinase